MHVVVCSYYSNVPKMNILNCHLLPRLHITICWVLTPVSWYLSDHPWKTQAPSPYLYETHNSHLAGRPREYVEYQVAPFDNTPGYAMYHAGQATDSLLGRVVECWRATEYINWNTLLNLSTFICIYKLSFFMFLIQFRRNVVLCSLHSYSY